MFNLLLGVVYQCFSDETIATIEEKYKRKEKDLSIKEKKKVKEILQKAKDNPDEINKKIEDLFGFTSDS